MKRIVDGFLEQVEDFKINEMTESIYLHFCDYMEFPGFDSIAEMLQHTNKTLLFNMYGDEKHPDIFDKAWDKAVNKALTEEAEHEGNTGND